MKRLNTKTLAALGFLVYFASYVTRYNYKTIIAEIVAAEGILDSAASLPVTFSFLSYGIGQLISGYIGDRVSPQKLIIAGLLSSSVINLFMTSGMGITVMSILWTLNGLAQSFIWPPLIKILSGSMSREDYNKSIVIVNAAGSIGTVFIHLAAPLLIHMSGWKAVFVFSAIVGVISILLFSSLTRKAEIVTVPESADDSGKGDGDKGSHKLVPVVLSSGLVFICFAIVFMGILRDGIDSWTPTYLSATYGLPTTSSIFLSVVVPLFSIVSFKVTSEINRRFIKNELSLAIILFTISAICTGLTVVVPVMPVSIILLSLATGCMHGVNLMLVCQIPGRFAKYGKASLVSGAMNFFTYVGSALSMWGLAKISETSGWDAVFFTCSGIAVFGLLMCLLSIKKWKSFSDDN
ncbi:MAG: MFS transporter [Clostridia bacterium]|nr:MFS transporter [Clostridia bacterium]